MRVQGPVCSSLPRHWPCWSELQAAQWGLGFLFKCVRVRPYQCCGHPLSPYQSGPPRGEIGRAAPFCTVVPCKHRAQLLVILPVFMWCESRCSLKDLLCLFPSPWALSMSPGQSFWDLSLVLDHGSFSGTPSSVQWDESWGLETMWAEILLKLQVSRGSQRPPAKK